jgi:hypothetical protein
MSLPNSATASWGIAQKRLQVSMKAFLSIPPEVVKLTV